MADGPQPDRRVPVGVLICDDHEVLRHGLLAALRWAPDLAVVGQAADTEQARSVLATTRAQVALVGLGDGGAAVRELVRTLLDAGVRVVLIGEPAREEDLLAALRAGVRGFVRTTVSPGRLVDGVRAVAAGQTVLDPAVAGELLERLGAQAEEGGRPSSGPLTARQQEVAELVAEGLTNAEIAARLQVSRATVKGHITVALRRLQLRDRTQLAIYVHRTARPDDRGGQAGA
jgi:DNA-binding NarL/FixJ family response regulator